MDVLRDIMDYIVTAIVLWNAWLTREMYELKKEQALNTQNDQSMKQFLERIEGIIEKLTKEVRILNNAFLREFPNSNHGIE